MGALALKLSSKKDTQITGSSTNSGNSSQTASDKVTAALKPGTIDTADFTYPKPNAWAVLAKSRLDLTGANSGIGVGAGPIATFTTRVSSAAPSSNSDLTSSTLSELKKLSKFQLVSDVVTKVNGKSGQKFTYKFSDTSTVRQEMSVIVYKNKTYFLLFSATDSDFDKQAIDFNAILSGFKFK